MWQIPGVLPMGSAGLGRAAMDFPAPSCHGSLHKRPLPSLAPLGCACFGVSVLSPPGWLPAPGPLASSCVCVLRAPPPTLCSVSKVPQPRRGCHSLCPLPNVGCPRVGRGFNWPLLSCKDEGECQGRAAHDRRHPSCCVSARPLVTCWGLYT